MNHSTHFGPPTYATCIRSEIFLRHEPCPWEQFPKRPNPLKIVALNDLDLFRELMNTRHGIEEHIFKYAVAAALCASADPRECVRVCDHAHLDALHYIVQEIEHDLVLSCRDDVYDHFKRRAARIALQEIERIHPEYFEKRVYWIPVAQPLLIVDN